MMQSFVMVFWLEFCFTCFEFPGNVRFVFTGWKKKKKGWKHLLNNFQHMCQITFIPVQSPFRYKMLCLLWFPPPLYILLHQFIEKECLKRVYTRMKQEIVSILSLFIFQFIPRSKVISDLNSWCDLFLRFREIYWNFYNPITEKFVWNLIKV